MKIKTLSLITLISFAGSIESKNHKSKTEQEEASEASKKGFVRNLSDCIENVPTSRIIKGSAALGLLDVAKRIYRLEKSRNTAKPTLWKDPTNKFITVEMEPYYSSTPTQKVIGSLLAVGVGTAFYSALLASTRYANSKLRKWYGINDPKKETTEQNINLTNNQEVTKPLI